MLTTDGRVDSAVSCAADVVRLSNKRVECDGARRGGRDDLSANRGADDQDGRQHRVIISGGGAVAVRWTLGLALVACVLAGCGNDAPPEAAPSVTSSTAEQLRGDLRGGQQQQSAQAAVPIEQAAGDVLAPGRYRASRISPAVELTVGPGWRVLNNDRYSLALTKSESGPYLSVVDFDYAWGYTRGALTERQLEQEVRYRRPLGDPLEYFQQLPQHTASKPRPITIGGSPGQVIDNTAQRLPRGTATCPFGTPPVRCTPVLGWGPDRTRQSPQDSGISSGEGLLGRAAIIDSQPSVVFLSAANDRQGLAAAEAIVQTAVIHP